MSPTVGKQTKHISYACLHGEEHRCKGFTYANRRTRKCVCACHNYCACAAPQEGRLTCLRCGKNLRYLRPRATITEHSTEPMF